MVDDRKLREVFPNTTVYKNQNVMSIFKSASIPAFLRDWILKKKADNDGKVSDADALRRYIDEIIPRREDTLKLKDAATTGGSTKKFLAKIDIQLRIGDGEYTFEIADLGISHGETLIEDYVLSRIRKDENDVLKTSGGWGLIQLGYMQPEEHRKKRGKLTLLEFKNFCPYIVDVDTYREARQRFTIEEWMDVLLSAIDYNPDGYEDWISKHTMLTRLLPFIEPRINLIELAPKGTGKSYMFGRIGKYGWLASGGTLSRAKMFYDISRKQPGLVATSDFVALDEIQSINFPDAGEMQGALKAYMESGETTFGATRVVGEAGIILLGNIPQENMDETQNMFKTLPAVFHESALLDRFHGFIRGRNIPRMNENLKVNGWALNTEYFTEIMHRMRLPSECMMYRNVVEQLVSYPKDADTRDTEAILRICTAYLKLLFPHVTSPEMVNKSEFHYHCLRPAIIMRRIIRQQLQVIDPKEFGGKNLSQYDVK